MWCGLIGLGKTGDRWRAFKGLSPFRTRSRLGTAGMGIGSPLTRSDSGNGDRPLQADLSLAFAPRPWIGGGLERI